MLTSTLISLFLGLSFSLIMCTTPLAAALWVISLALFASLTLSQYLYSWFGLMLFLIYVGGMLVMFAYFLALQPNQHMEITPPALTLLMSTLIMASLSAPSTMHSMESSKWLTPLMSASGTPIIILLALSLFLALLTVVKITSLSKGPLRPYLYV